MSEANYQITAQDGDSGWLAKLVEGMEDRTKLNAALGRRLASDLRDWFAHRDVDGPRNKLGGTPSGFWGEIEQSVLDPKADNDGATVVISDPRFAQKFYGGTIHMDEKLLAIPARTEAYGHSPRDFTNLKAVFFHSGAIALVSFTPEAKAEKGEKRIGKANQDELVFFWLAEQVTQEKDPNALPPREKIIAGLEKTGQRYLERVKEEAEANASASPQGNDSTTTTN